MMKNLESTLQSILDEAVDTGFECGCQLTVYQDDELVADLCAGYTAPDRQTAVTPDTLFPVFSAGKALAATAVHRLVERGVLDYSTRVGDVWPEFDCEGKEGVLLWHLLTHSAALFRTPETASAEELADWDLMCSRVAAMRPEWEPGTRAEYHPCTFAWLLGETAARADGRSFREIIADEVIRPLGLEDELFFGTTPEADRRFAPVDHSSVEKNHEFAKLMNHPVIRHCFSPSFNGVMTARAIARHYAMLDRELLRPETLDHAAVVRLVSDDSAIIPGIRFGLGYIIYRPEENDDCLVGHAGALGTQGLLDRRRGLAFGFTRNRIGPYRPNLPDNPIRGRIARALGLSVRNW